MVDFAKLLADRRAGKVCRTDGRCQYAMDHGAEGLGHCPAGKCVMPSTTAPRATQQPGFIRTPDFINVEKETFMSLETELQANTAALTALTAALVATAKLAPSAAAAATVDKPKVEAGKAPAAAKPAAPAAAPADFKTTVGPKVAAAVNRVGRDPVIAMLAEKFSAKKASDVPAEKWTELGEALDGLNAETEDPLG